METPSSAIRKAISVLQVVTDADDGQARVDVVLLTGPRELHEELRVVRLVRRHIALKRLVRRETVDFVEHDDDRVVQLVDDRPQSVVVRTRRDPGLGDVDIGAVAIVELRREPDDGLRFAASLRAVDDDEPDVRVRVGAALDDLATDVLRDQGLPRPALAEDERALSGRTVDRRLESVRDGLDLFVPADDLLLVWDDVRVEEALVSEDRVWFVEDGERVVTRWTRRARVRYGAVGRREVTERIAIGAHTTTFQMKSVLLEGEGSFG